MRSGWIGAALFGLGAAVLGLITFWTLPTSSPRQSLVGVVGTFFLLGCARVCAKHGSSDQ